VEFLKGAEEMVAGAADNRSSFAGSAHRPGRGFGPGALYLYFILINPGGTNFVRMKKRRKQIETLVVIALFLLVLARLHRSWAYVYSAAGLLALGLVWKDFADKLHIGWMKLAEGLGFVTGKILLTLLYFLLLLPLSVFAKRSRKLNIRLKAGEKTGFRDRDHTFVKEDLDNPW
jgi:hypothetical protein